jgi:nitrate/nitrite-specific signal transduction histidine kinase
MNKLTSKIATPIILVGIFVTVVFVSLGYEDMGLGFFVILFLLVFFVFFFGFSIGQSFSAPVKKLLDRATDISKGDFKARAYIETKDELSELAKIFNKIADQLESSKNETETAEKSADIRVRARTQELQEIISALEQKVKNRTIEYEKMMEQVQTLQQSTKEKESEITDLEKQIKELKTS